MRVHLSVVVLAALASLPAWAEAEPPAVTAAPEAKAAEAEVGRAQQGGAGLSRVRSGFVAKRALAVSVSGGFFRAPALTAPGGTDEYRVTQFGAAYGATEWLELSATLRSVTLDQQAAPLRNYYLVNDVFLRGKAGWLFVGDTVAVGAELWLRLPPPLFRASPFWQGLSPGLGGVFSYDLSKLGTPVVFHVNTGFFLDNSVDFDDGSGDVSRRFALDITTYNQWRSAVGVEGRLRLAGLGVRPFLEYAVDVPLGAGGAPPMRLVPGVRLLPWRGLFVDAAVEVGLTRPTARGVLPVAPWQVSLALGYQTGVDDAPGRRDVVERVVEKEKPVPAAPAAPRRGRVRGVVSDVSTRAVLADASVALKGRNRLLTESDGSFLLDEFEPGPVQVTVARQGYAPREVTGTVQAGATAELKVALTSLPPEPPPPMVVRGTVLSEGDKPVASTVALPTAGVSKKSALNGEYEVSVPSGEQPIEVSAAGYLTQGRRVTGRAGETVVLDFVLKPVPKQTLVVLKKEKIEIKKQVHFATAKDVILPDSAPLLDQVASTILENDRLRLIRIEGHTDDQGDDAYNLNLSDRRAKSVMRALLERGVEAGRLNAIGFGETKPIGSNKTPKGRADNRRVEFMIETQD